MDESMTRDELNSLGKKRRDDRVITKSQNIG